MESVPSRAVLRAWPLWLPCAALVPVGLVARLGLPSSPALAFAVTAVALAGAAMAWATARLLTGKMSRAAGIGAVALNLGLLAIAGVGLARGAVERAADDARAEAKRNAERAVQDVGGWIGGALVGGARIQATEIDPRSELGRMLRDSFAERFIPVVLTIDNPATRELVVDATTATLRHADGSVRPALDRERVLGSAREGAAQLRAMHGGVYHVPANGRLGNGLVFISPDERFEDVVAMVLTVDGQPLALRGRFLTAEAKRAMRASTPPR